MGRLTASKKTLRPDPKCGSILASKFINCLMWDGKKSVAERVVYDALEIIREKIKDVEPIEVFTQALENVKPNIEVRSKRVGGASYQVPMQVSRNRQQSLAIRWILGSVREKKGRPTSE
jgi:small subunit ribosomal protein S7